MNESEPSMKHRESGTCCQNRDIWRSQG